MCWQQFSALMHKVTIILFSTLISLASKSQTSLNKDVIDTINLKNFHSDKVVSYKYNTVTFFLNYDDFNRDIIKFATDYKNDQPIKYPRSSYRIYKDSKKGH